MFIKKIGGAVLNRGLSSFGLQIRRIGSGFWDRDVEFMALYKTIQDKTVVKIDRSYMLYQFAKVAANLPHGDVAQLGVYKGGTAWMIASCFRHTQKKFYLFDTFAGLPQSSSSDGHWHSIAEGNDFSDVLFQEVQKYFSPYQNIKFKKGLFPATAVGLEDARFSFVYLDADLYQSTKDGLEFFYPRMVPGGVIMLDDFGTPTWPGIQKAVEEFCNEQGIVPVTTTWWQGMIIKGS